MPYLMNHTEQWTVHPNLYISIIRKAWLEGQQPIRACASRWCMCVCNTWTFACVDVCVSALVHISKSRCRSTSTPSDMVWIGFHFISSFVNYCKQMIISASYRIILSEFSFTHLLSQFIADISSFFQPINQSHTIWMGYCISQISTIHMSSTLFR